MEITETHFTQNFEGSRQRFLFSDFREELNGLAYRQLENVVNGFPPKLHSEHMGLKSFALAFGAANIQIAQELHLDFLEAGPAATLAATAAGIE